MAPAADCEGVAAPLPMGEGAPWPGSFGKAPGRPRCSNLLAPNQWPRNSLVSFSMVTKPSTTICLARLRLGEPPVSGAALPELLAPLAPLASMALAPLASMALASALGERPMEEIPLTSAAAPSEAPRQTAPGWLANTIAPAAGVLGVLVPRSKAMAAPRGPMFRPPAAASPTPLRWGDLSGDLGSPGLGTDTIDRDEGVGDRDATDGEEGTPSDDAPPRPELLAAPGLPPTLSSAGCTSTRRISGVVPRGVVPREEDGHMAHLAAPPRLPVQHHLLCPTAGARR
mmetsp:Transcript_122632/g.273876  ORF Transcript_122632/g.273876 Transcript_122632/m.273876 type:complete len:285 (-) Transcript_122632:103-957(-)